MSRTLSTSSRATALVAGLALGALALTGCAGTTGAQSGQSMAAGAMSEDHDHDHMSGEAHDHEHEGELHGSDRFVLTHEGGIKVLDGSTLEEKADFPTSGFLRLNPFGDNEHVLVTTEKGFQVLSTGAGGGKAALTDLVFPADKAGHVVPHAGNTTLFADGTGEITIVPTDALGHDADETPTALPKVETVKSEAPHHGVAVKLSDGSLVRTIGTSEKRTGALVQDASGKEIARNEECPGVHGEGAVKGEAVVIGCENGVLVLKGGAFTKLASPDAAYGRVGNAYVTENSPIAVTDYKDDKDAEGYLLHRVGIVDTTANTFEVVDLPKGVEYTWRGIRRDHDGNAWILATDGKLHKLDLTQKKVTDSIDVIGAWQGPDKWQNAHPALTISEDVAWVTEPAKKTVHRVDLASGDVTSKAVGVAPNEVAFAKHTHKH
ncbi:hypothetical protein I6B53_01835 [Schaalia sp. 19OD2882]|uniref:hypothetical protein n=1 Tax=Schaalia sp. 19OD2882 TaxID=2794089 RepID=UPI001C1EE628|nr:hypothetical protein [Schaalia sp. 19OD2882]QWW19890.1 hypothetical protein I6B53_01835 [Schaalia sp. 19OD2882]